MGRLADARKRDGWVRQTSRLFFRPNSPMSFISIF